MPIYQTSIFSGRISRSPSPHGSILGKYPTVLQISCLFLVQIIQQSLSSWINFGKISNSSRDLLSLLLVDYLTAPKLMVLFWENIQQFSRSFVFTSGRLSKSPSAHGSTKISNSSPNLLSIFWQIIQKPSAHGSILR